MPGRITNGVSLHMTADFSLHAIGPSPSVARDVFAPEALR
jgi:hypothetical protein